MASDKPEAERSSARLTHLAPSLGKTAYARWLGYARIDDQRRKESDSEPPSPSITHFATPRTWHRLLAAVLRFLTPSFIYSRWSRNPPASHKLTPTSWLDGLRGIACFIVFIYHYFYAYFETRGHAFEFTGDKNHYFLQLPGLRIIHSGRSMVHIFFVISGFALSNRSVMLIRKSMAPAERSHAILSNLASSIWRRHLRLFLPCAGAYLLVAVVVAAGGFEVVPIGEKGWLKGNVEFRPTREKGLWSQLVVAFCEYGKIAGPVALFRGWSWPDYISVYESHLWTIPEEFHQSMLLFLIIAGLCHLKRWARVYVFLPAFVSVSLLNRRWATSLFMFGFFAAEVHAVVAAARENSLQSKLPGGVYSSFRNPQPGRRRLEIVQKGAVAFTFAVAIYLCSIPDYQPDSKSVTGFTTLAHSAPERYGGDDANGFWMSIGAELLVFSIIFLPAVQDVLCWRVFQYLGRISFALYLVHGTTNRSIGYAMVHWGWKVTGVGAMFVEGAKVDDLYVLETIRVAVVFVAFFANLLVTIWLADVFWRAFDLPSVRFVRWLEGKLVRS
ncbi:hypothetical protein DRE_05357 [Drechslerella stenobrocha 248]|uniref:Acyltransferase 3 domain-containing protein n=1 Tax=Drechslerella stenobrocha 248 TaxID=1043628 RepID=W7HQT6_9PEZI|nr:hypothetical protein DRE_05357 [Drechslerella stenobrocha 248]